MFMCIYVHFVGEFFFISIVLSSFIVYRFDCYCVRQRSCCLYSMLFESSCINVSLISTVPYASHTVYMFPVYN